MNRQTGSYQLTLLQSLLMRLDLLGQSVPRAIKYEQNYVSESYTLLFLFLCLTFFCSYSSPPPSQNLYHCFEKNCAHNSKVFKSTKK